MSAGPLRRSGDRRHRRPAQQLLEAKPGTDDRVRRRRSARRAPTRRRTAHVSPNTSQGPPPAVCPSPISRPPRPRCHGRHRRQAPSSPAGARSPPRGVAVIAAELAQRRPDLSPAQLRATLIARRRARRSAPRPRPARAQAPGRLRGVTANPPTAVSGALVPIQVQLTHRPPAGSSVPRPRRRDAPSRRARRWSPGTPTTVNVRGRRARHGLRPPRGRRQRHATDGLASRGWCARTPSSRSRSAR